MQQPPPGGWRQPPYPVVYQPASQAYGYVQSPYAAPASVWCCPFCHSFVRPVELSKISTGGWVVFVVLLICCLPLFWIGLLIKDHYRVCSSCGQNLGPVA